MVVIFNIVVIYFSMQKCIYTVKLHVQLTPVRNHRDVTSVSKLFPLSILCWNMLICGKQRSSLIIHVANRTICGFSIKLMLLWGSIRQAFESLAVVHTLPVLYGIWAVIIWMRENSQLQQVSLHLWMQGIEVIPRTLHQMKTLILLQTRNLKSRLEVQHILPNEGDRV